MSFIINSIPDKCLIGLCSFISDIVQAKADNWKEDMNEEEMEIRKFAMENGKINCLSIYFIESLIVIVYDVCEWFLILIDN